MGFFNIPPPSGGGGQGASTAGGSAPQSGLPGGAYRNPPRVNIPVATRLGPKSFTAGGFAPYQKIATSALTAAKGIKAKYYR